MESGGSGGSSSKKGKKVEQQSKKRQKTNTIDYMNYIPEAIVFHILSLLPLGELIIMSLVSQRWKDTVVRYLKIVPSSLNLDECEMPGTILKRDGQCLLRSNFAHSGYSLQQRHCLIRAVRKSFIEFVDRCLQLHSNCMINNLRLTFLHEAGGDYEYTRKIDRWVHFAFTNDIKELSLDFSDLTLSKPLAQPFELPHGYFAPKITKTFSLKFCKFRLSTFRVFGFLKGISLVQVEILDGSLAELASKCPVLKDVNLVNCVFPDQFMMSEEDIIVEKLSVIDCKTEEWEACNINLSTPHLLKLHIVGNILMTSHIRNATKLLDVTFCMEEINENYLQGDALGSFFIELGHSRSLTVNNCCIQVSRSSFNWL